ncbi:MAG TPA: hypothetical protein VM783_00225, partial [Candidatus Acidoferrum sp.]|nr:hypothetical protein [Candidatus Acidoferrum sp.]
LFLVDEEKRLCAATIEDLERELQTEPNRRRRQRLRRIIDELKMRWTLSLTRLYWRSASHTDVLLNYLSYLINVYLQNLGR